VLEPPLTINYRDQVPCKPTVGAYNAPPTPYLDLRGPLHGRKGIRKGRKAEK